MLRPSESMVKKLKEQTCVLHPSVEAGDSKKVPVHLTWPVITRYPLDSADTLLTLPQAKHIVASFLNKMTPTLFKTSPYPAANVSAAAWSVLVNGLCVVCMKPNSMNITVS